MSCQLLIHIYYIMRKQQIPDFIKKTWQMLQSEHNKAIVCWTQSQTSFSILNQSIFAQQILPQYFKHAKLSSFLRQLNMYNFKRRKTGQNKVQFTHRLFQKKYFSLLAGIKRRPSEEDKAYAQELLSKIAFGSTQAAYLTKIEHPVQEDMLVIESSKTQRNPQILRHQIGYNTMNPGWFFTPMSFCSQYTAPQSDQHLATYKSISVQNPFNIEGPFFYFYNTA